MSLDGGIMHVDRCGFEAILYRAVWAVVIGARTREGRAWILEDSKNRLLQLGNSSRFGPESFAEVGDIVHALRRGQTQTILQILVEIGLLLGLSLSHEI